ncbi:MAG: membrane protein insertion efficiency factor YidD [Candidatus Marinimicrobia bacterium]|nr:membrane protein insertion efficiency factor YidD [Candidatus Neomarinimicrobiota bacterium]MBT7495521.1 membrane protein insertion efficiency factor YidD [Candidatus Neomarinimicrobiota bacterium]
MKPLIKTLLFTIPLFAQYPADSLFSAPDTSPLQKIFLYPITKWQRFSYNESSLNCQFAPSCSNYGAQAIHTHGTVKGLFMTSDRIIRCNANAFFYHQKMGGQFHSDGRLIDPINYNSTIHSPKSPVLAAGLSMVVPGLGRAFAGRPMDGFYGFLLSALSISAGVKSIKRESIFAPLYVGMAVTIYGGEVYGAYRTAKYYQP